MYTLYININLKLKNKVEGLCIEFLRYAIMRKTNLKIYKKNCKNFKLNYKEKIKQSVRMDFKTALRVRIFPQARISPNC